MKKSLILYLILGFAALAASSGILAHHYHGRVRKAEAALAKEQGRNAAARVARISHQERTYLKALLDRYGISPKENETASDAIAVAARMNQEINRTVPAEYSKAKTPWLPPSPRTLLGRTLANSQTLPFSLVDQRLELPQTPALYQYSISNPTTAPVAMPVIHSGIRWDDAEAMVETAGLRGIADEVDRAIAIWKFVSTHRYHAKPVTEGPEEHDTVRFFAFYGYGFCDDASQAVAGLAKLCGLEARIWGLEGHVVPEVFAGGRWMLLDADFAAYFHKPGEPRAVLGVEELASSRDAFKHAVQLGSLGPFDKGYAEFFLTKEDNKPWPVEARSDFRIAATLLPEDRVVFSNFNWGKYFIGAYPNRVPRYFNGYFERPLSADAFTVADGMEIRREGTAFTIANRAHREKRAEAIIEWPFPIVGGTVESPVAVKLEFEDSVAERKIRLAQGRSVSLDGAVTQVSKQPTTKFTLSVVVPAGGMLKFEKPMLLICDFQFAEMPLLRLKSGVNDFKAHSTAPESLKGLAAELSWK